MDNHPLAHFTCPRWEALPDLALYMDQVILVMGPVLAPLALPGEKAITSTMVNNYVKHKLVPPPNKKKYQRPQLARLLVVSILKRVLSMEEIATLMDLLADSLGPQPAYDLFAQRLEQAVQGAFGRGEIRAGTTGDRAEDALSAALAALAGKLLIETRLCPPAPGGQDLFPGTVTVQQMQALEAGAAAYGRSLSHLMACAGAALAGAAKDMLAGAPGGVAIFCGPGNNGGDGWVCARLLAEAGVAVTVYTPGVLKYRADTLWGAAALAWQAAGRETVALGADTGSLAGETPALVIDCLFGTGLRREPRGLFAKAIGLMNALPAPVLACDVPSGVVADSGAVPGPAVEATRTLVLGRYKRACALEPGQRYFGRLLLADIGLEG